MCSFVEHGKNPDIFTQGFVERAATENQFTNGKIKAVSVSHFILLVFCVVTQCIRNSKASYQKSSLNRFRTSMTLHHKNKISFFLSHSIVMRGAPKWEIGTTSHFNGRYVLREASFFFLFPCTKMKLTADLINNSISHINPVGDRELILRGKVTRLYK